MDLLNITKVAELRRELDSIVSGASYLGSPSTENKITKNAVEQATATATGAAVGVSLGVVLVAAVVAIVYARFVGKQQAWGQAHVAGTALAASRVMAGGGGTPNPVFNVGAVVDPRTGQFVVNDAGPGSSGPLGAGQDQGEVGDGDLRRGSV